jgi:hypothetical protein
VELFDNISKYKDKINNAKKPEVFCTGWKVCATKFFAARRIIRDRATRRVAPTVGVKAQAKGCGYMKGGQPGAAVLHGNFAEVSN